MRCYVIMGVSGCGKSSVGAALAERIGLTFIDGDDLHPKSNVEKMASGQPLDDNDRAPWLALIGRTLAETEGPVAIGCSALKRHYRDAIRTGATEPVAFVHLAASKEVLTRRVNEREGHFMPPALLDSQFDALEQLETSEDGTVVDISRPLDEVVAQAESYVRATLGD